MKREVKEPEHNQPEIDLVYLWVNGNDPAWVAKRNKIIGKTEQMSAVNCDGRYADNDELKYSLRSVEKYAPWIRRIFIVTDNQVPQWLDTDNPKIKVVDHKEIMPPEALPCFNSCVIEHFLCRIPGLSERFLYANDDMYLNRPVSPSTFYAPDGLPYIRVNRRPMRKLLLKFREKVLGKKMSYYNRVVQNAAELVERTLGKYYGAKEHHNIDAYLKSDWLHVEEMFSESLTPTFVNHVRTPNDIERSLYNYVAFAEKRAHPRFVTQRESLRIHIQNRKHYSKLDRYNPLFFCMNDSEYAGDDDRRMAAEFLRERFTHKSQFEK